MTNGPEPKPRAVFTTHAQRFGLADRVASQQVHVTEMRAWEPPFRWVLCLRGSVDTHPASQRWPRQGRVTLPAHDAPPRLAIVKRSSRLRRREQPVDPKALGGDVVGWLGRLRERRWQRRTRHGRLVCEERRTVPFASPRAFALADLKVPSTSSPCDGERLCAKSMLDVHKHGDLVVTVACKALDPGAAVRDASMDRGEAGADLLGWRERRHTEKVDRHGTAIPGSAHPAAA